MMSRRNLNRQMPVEDVRGLDSEFRSECLPSATALAVGRAHGSALCRRCRHAAPTASVWESPRLSLPVVDRIASRACGELRSTPPDDATSPAKLHLATPPSDN